MWVVAAAAPRAWVDSGGPRRAMAGVIREGGHGLSKPGVARPAEAHGPVLAGRTGDGGDAGLGREWSSVGKRARSSPSSAKTGRHDLAAAGKAIRSGPSGWWARAAALAAGATGFVRRAAGGRRPTPARVPLWPRLRSCRRAPRAAQAKSGSATPRRAAPAAVRVAGQEGGEALFPEGRGALGRGVAGEEGQGDGRVDLGEMPPAPGQKRSSSAQSWLASATRGATSRPARGRGPAAPGCRRQGPQRAEAGAVEAQQVGEQERVGGSSYPRRCGSGPGWP